MRHFNGSSYQDAYNHVSKYQKNRRELLIANNTNLIVTDTKAIIRFHWTDIITFYPDDTMSLTAGNWHSISTRGRINEFSGIRIHSNKGQWYLSNRITGISPEKIQKCRVCFGKNLSTIETSEQQVLAALSGIHIVKWGCCTDYYNKKIHILNCYRCSNTSYVDYGSKPQYVKFYNGITFNKDGEVIE